jgi:hypothetical protein
MGMKPRKNAPKKPTAKEIRAQKKREKDITDSADAILAGMQGKDATVVMHALAAAGAAACQNMGIPRAALASILLDISIGEQP